jgi:acyl-CoA reductase-like NAD-dependent aldehyde dehydrogenase
LLIPPACIYQPTVLSAVSADVRMLHEEMFVPIAPALRFQSDAEAIAQMEVIGARQPFTLVDGLPGARL